MSEVLRRSWVEQIMGLPISVLARGEHAGSPEVAAAVRQLFAQLREIDVRFSLYQPGSELSRLNRGELQLEDCHPDVTVVARRCAEATALTGGLFDPTTPAGIWDPSGLVKGWGAERASRSLPPIVDWCVNAGGDVVVRSAGGVPFTVGIADPDDPMAVVTSVRLTSGAVATSGTAARGAHLYDPRRNDQAVSPWLSVSISGPSLETCDVLATAAFVAGADWQQQLPPGYAGLAVGPGRQVQPSSGWAA